MRGNHLSPLPIFKIFAMFLLLFILIRLNNMAICFVLVKMHLKRILHGNNTVKIWQIIKLLV